MFVCHYVPGRRRNRPGAIMARITDTREPDTMAKAYWLSSPSMTVMVYTDEDNIITITPAIVKKFKGQHIDNLIKWMKKQGNLKISQL